GADVFYIPRTDRAHRPTNACRPAITAGSQPSLAASPAGCRWGLCCLQEAQAMADEKPRCGRGSRTSSGWKQDAQLRTNPVHRELVRPTTRRRSTCVRISTERQLRRTFGVSVFLMQYRPTILRPSKDAQASQGIPVGDERYRQ